jgi:hypothetical protein
MNKQKVEATKLASKAPSSSQKPIKSKESISLSGISGDKDFNNDDFEKKIEETLSHDLNKLVERIGKKDFS